MTGGQKYDTQIVYVDPHVLIPAEYNPRQASPKDYEDLKKSIERFGKPAPRIELARLKNDRPL